MKRNSFIAIFLVGIFLLTGTSVYGKGETLAGFSFEDIKSEDDLKENEIELDTEEDNRSEKVGTEETAHDKSNIIGNFSVLCQYPELPTGCEITSLAMLLNYYGFPIDKCVLADDYLDKGEVGTVDFRKAFEGNPRNEDSFGCYAPVIVNTANRYLDENDSELHAIDLTGTEFDDLLSYLDKENPVIVWGTLDCEEGYYSVTWNVDGQDITWFTPEHCRVLVNYDDENVWAADPVYGEIIQYDREVFTDRYNSLQKQAIVLGMKEDNHAVYSS